MHIVQIIEELRSQALSRQEKGRMFEKLIRAWLLANTTYKNDLSDVWLWTDFPATDQFGVHDPGIDLVARTLLMDSCRIKVDKDSGIKNDPNAWAREHGKPRYILDLLLSIINLSMQTLEVVEGLPGLKLEA